MEFFAPHAYATAPPTLTMPASPTRQDPTQILQALDQLEASSEPAVVFSSLAAILVPAFASTCTITVAEPQASYQICQPTPAGSTAGEARSEAAISKNTLAVSVRDQLARRQDGFSAVITLGWDDGERPTRSDAVIAQLLADRALHVIRHQRLSEEAAHLRVALDSNREIGKALGILMLTYKLTSQQAFDLLRGVSQHTHRKLRDVAVDVTETGTLDIPAAAKIKAVGSSGAAAGRSAAS